jgi:CheY-like chemotaxis protein
MNKPYASLEQPFPPVKILVVEDNPINQKVIVHQLQSLGYATDLATNGQAAIQCTVETYYPIILMDCRLPHIDGYTATRYIRSQIADQGNPQPIIIALTASDDPQAEAEAKAAGMNDFLTKPLRRETLATAIDRWMQVVLTAKVIQAKPLNSTSADAEELTSKRFDFNQLHQLSDHNSEFEQELLQLYFEDTQLHLQQLQQAFNQQNRLQLEHLAHHIKGASANIGARQLAQLAAQIEQQAQNETLQVLQHLLLQLRQVFQETQTFFEAMHQVVALEIEQPESEQGSRL